MFRLVVLDYRFPLILEKNWIKSFVSVATCHRVKQRKTSDDMDVRNVGDKRM